MSWLGETSISLIITEPLTSQTSVTAHDTKHYHLITSARQTVFPINIYLHKKTLLWDLIEQMNDTQIEKLKSVILYLCIDFILSYLLPNISKNLQFNVLVHNALPQCQSVQQYYLCNKWFPTRLGFTPPHLTERKKILNSFNFPDYRPILPWIFAPVRYTVDLFLKISLL